MQIHEAACSCGQLRLTAEGDPVRISICHCLACQRRTGSAFGVQARFPAERVQVTGGHNEYVRLSDEGGEERRFRFCPECGATVFYTTAHSEHLIAVPVGAFADPLFPRPALAVFEHRRHPWVGLPDDVERDDAWESIRPLYEAGEYAEAAERGRVLLDAHPSYGELAYNVACCEALTGQVDEAVEHLRMAFRRQEELRDQAANDPDFDRIRDRPAFEALVG